MSTGKKSTLESIPTYAQFYENVANCSNVSKAILITGSVLWTVLTFILVIWTIIYTSNLKNNDYDPTQVNEIATGFYLTMFIIYIVISAIIITAVLIVIFKTYTNKNTGTKCITSGTFKFTYLVYGLIMIFGIVYSILVITILLPSARSVDEEEIVKIEPRSASFFIIGGIVLLSLNVLLLIFSTIITFTKSGKSPVTVETSEKESTSKGGILGKINEKILDYKSDQINNEYLNEDFDRVKMANITSQINTTNVEKVYPDQLKPASPKNNKDYADKSLEICSQEFKQGSPRYTIAGGNKERDSCKYWGLKPNQSLKSENVQGTVGKTYTVIEK